jgi:hypothetical protein
MAQKNEPQPKEMSFLCDESDEAEVKNPQTENQ